MKKNKLTLTDIEKAARHDGTTRVSPWGLYGSGWRLVVAHGVTLADDESISLAKIPKPTGVLRGTTIVARARAVPRRSGGDPLPTPPAPDAAPIDLGHVAAVAPVRHAHKVSRPNIEGVAILAAGGACATDGIRLHVSSPRPVRDRSDLDVAASVPGGAVPLALALARDPGARAVREGDRVIVDATTADGIPVRLTSTTLEARFPDIGQVLPRSVPPSRYVVDGADRGGLGTYETAIDLDAARAEETAWALAHPDLSPPGVAHAEDPAPPRGPGEPFRAPYGLRYAAETAAFVGHGSRLRCEITITSDGKNGARAAYSPLVARSDDGGRLVLLMPLRH